MHQNFTKYDLKGDVIITDRLAYICLRSKRSWFQYRYPVRIRIKAELPGIELEETLEIEVDPKMADKEATSESEDEDDPN